MSIREEVLEVLRSSEASRIRFSFTSLYSDTISINHTNFLSVVSRIESGRISVETEGISPEREGEYDGAPENGGVLYVRPLINRTRKAVVIHEAVHAAFDRPGFTLAWIDDEVAGFLAEFLYLRLASCSYADVLLANPGGDWFCESFWRVSGAFVNGGTLSEAQMEHLRQRIREQPGYSRVLCSEDESCIHRIRTYNG